jgi:secreted Zn-dependent insulinase-like peptidase
MAYTANPQKQQFWKVHLIQAREFNGSINEYCRGQGMQASTFQYWKQKLTKRSAESRLPVPSPFIPVRVSTPVTQTSRKSLPDPKWLAEIIFELHARFQ